MGSCGSAPLGFPAIHGAGLSSFHSSEERLDGLLIRCSSRHGDKGTAMPRLSSEELQIIRSMLVKKFGAASPLLDGIQSLKFEKRHMTGTGYYANFSNSQDLHSINKLDAELSQELRTTLPSPHDMVGFTLFIREGYLTSFEGYTFGDVRWPNGLTENWLIFDAS